MSRIPTVLRHLDRTAQRQRTLLRTAKDRVLVEISTSSSAFAVPATRDSYRFGQTKDWRPCSDASKSLYLSMAPRETVVRDVRHVFAEAVRSQLSAGRPDVIEPRRLWNTNCGEQPLPCSLLFGVRPVAECCDRLGQ